MNIEKVKQKLLRNCEVDSNTGCWNWKKSRDVLGYGHISTDKIQWKAHRLSYTVFVTEIPDDLSVCHKCDNPSCINPEHLFLGTTADNMRDRNEKGRQARGEKNSHCKITEADVLEIRRLYATGDYTYWQLGKIFGIYQQAVYRIVKNLSWKHI